MSEWVLVARVGEIAPGQYRLIEIDEVPIAVFNLEGEFFAIEDICTHDGGVLTGGSIEGCQIECPRHGARFDIRTGAALTAPAYEPTATFPIKIENDTVYTRDERWD